MYFVGGCGFGRVDGDGWGLLGCEQAGLKYAMETMSTDILIQIDFLRDFVVVFPQDRQSSVVAE